MNMNEFLTAGLKQSLEMLKMTIADMSDADLLTRPVPTANHPNWQIGHLIVSESHLLSQVGAKLPELPAGFADRYKKETATIDDPSKLATKADLIALFEKTRAGSIAWTATLTDAQLSGPTPMKDFAPTVAALINMNNVHIAMHLGQIQVLRRKLNKPILF